MIKHGEKEKQERIKREKRKDFERLDQLEK